jgi:8-oxo-dGTP pyrophosphatase MutT (NUDIX family)
MRRKNSRRGPFKLISSKLVYGNPWIVVREDAVIRPGGSRGIFGVINMAGGGSVLPLDKNGYVYLAKEYKYGIERESVEAFSGGRAKGEEPIDAVKRELKEELGMTAKEWTYLGYVDPFTTVAYAPNHMFLAKGLKHTRRSPDRGEQIQILHVKFKDAISMVMQGQITHSASCVLILKVAKLLGIAN